MLKIDHLRKNYGSFALDCTLEVQPGCITGLIGQNGAGKSTTFKAALGLISTEGGSIQIFGKDLKDFTAEDKQGLGVVLSDSGFSGYLTIEDIIPVMESLYAKFDKTFFKEQVKRFQLPEKKRLKDFSTGMKAKLKVLAAISHNAKLLILDEPTDHLDMESITALNNGLIKFPGVLLFSSRDHQIVQTTANRIIEIMPNGSIIDKITTYDEYLASDAMARKRTIYTANKEDDEN